MCSPFIFLGMQFLNMHFLNFFFRDITFLKSDPNGFKSDPTEFFLPIVLVIAG
jgi:hypothetical protein